MCTRAAFPRGRHGQETGTVGMHLVIEEGSRDRRRTCTWRGHAGRGLWPGVCPEPRLPHRRPACTRVRGSARLRWKSDAALECSLAGTFVFFWLCLSIVDMALRLEKHDGGFVVCWLRAGMAAEEQGLLRYEGRRCGFNRYWIPRGGEWWSGPPRPSCASVLSVSADAYVRAYRPRVLACTHRCRTC